MKHTTVIAIELSSTLLFIIKGLPFVFSSPTQENTFSGELCKALN